MLNTLFTTIGKGCNCSLMQAFLFKFSVFKTLLVTSQDAGKILQKNYLPYFSDPGYQIILLQNYLPFMIPTFFALSGEDIF